MVMEAEVMENGLCMGTVGDRIVDDLFIGLLNTHSDSDFATTGGGSCF
jgi:hypothetical protein